MNANDAELNDIVGWSNHDDEPEIRGRIVDLNRDYGSITAAYTTASGRGMSCMAPASTFRFIMRGI